MPSWRTTRAVPTDGTVSLGVRTARTMATAGDALSTICAVVGEDVGDCAAHGAIRLSRQRRLKLVLNRDCTVNLPLAKDRTTETEVYRSGRLCL
jgi:hypothetical protein